MTNIVNKVPFGESTDEQLTILIGWKCDSFDILLIKNQSAWLGSASSGHVKLLSEFVNLTIEDYINETKTALSKPGGLPEFSYHITNNQFVWKKVIQEDITIRFGFIPLEETSYPESCRKILDVLMQQNYSLQVEVDGLQKTNKRSTAERAVLMEKLVEYKKQKLDMERTLYAQFVAVLNKKKKVLNQIEDNGLDGNNIPSSTKSNSDHYGSDTEVEDTDTEEKGNRENMSDEELFETDAKPTISIPKRVVRRRRISQQSEDSREKPGPSKRKPFISKETEPVIETTNTQDLWDDL